MGITKFKMLKLLQICLMATTGYAVIMQNEAALTSTTEGT